MPMVELFDQLVTRNPCPITAATYLEALTCELETRYISDSKLESLENLPSHTRHAHSIAEGLFNTISMKSQIVWDTIVYGGSYPRVRSGDRSTDCLLIALARLFVLLEYLENNKKTSEAWPQGILHEARNGIEVAQKSALLQVSRMHDTIYQCKLYTMDTYIGLLEGPPGSAGRSLAMECLTRSLVRKASSVKPMSPDTKTEEQSFVTLLYNILDTRLSDPLVVDSSLKLRGALLAYHYTLVGSLDTVLIRNVEIWTQMLKLAGHERSVGTK